MRLFSILLLSIVIAWSEPIEAKPFDAKLSYRMNYDKNTTCTIRNLKVYEQPKWVAKIALRSGKELYFCGPKSMFEFYFNQAKWEQYGVKSQDDFIAISVTDYNTLQPINAKSAFFVYGSRAISLAGDDLPAFGDKAMAQDFADKYSGKRVFGFEQVSDALIRLLNGKI